MGVRGLSGHELAALAPTGAARTPAASDASPRKIAAEKAAPATVPEPDAVVRAIQAEADRVEASRDAQARQDEAARNTATEPVVARHEVRLRMDQESKRVIAQLVDETNSVIKQIPPQELLDIAARFRKLNGMLFDRQS